MMEERASHAPSPSSTTTTTTTTTTSTTTLLEAYATHDLVESLLKSRDEDDDYASGTKDSSFEEALNRRAREVETKLADVERRSVDEHAAECENLLALKEDVDACARILSSLQTKVESFQDNLGRISSDIRGLQRQSVELRVQTRNRVEAEAALGRVVQSLAIEPSLINAVFNAEDVANDDFLDALESLDAKLCAIGGMKPSDASSPRILAVNDVAPELERLRVKACERVWKFLHGEFSDLAKPLANVQQTQERVLIRYVPLIQFLRKHGKEVYWEIKALYVAVVSKSIKASAASYLEQLDKLAGRGVPAVDLASPTVSSKDAHADGAAATGVGALTGMFAFASSSAASAATNWTRDEVEGAFTLGSRFETVRAAETEPPLVVHVKSDKVTQSTQSIEELFRSANRLLIDTATFEYTFCEQFWRGEREVFESVFSPALATFNDFSSTCVSRASRDAIGLLILICVNDAHRRVMSTRRIPALDGYFDGVNLNAWPRFKAVCDVHVQSLIDMKDSFEPKPEAPSYVVKRFVELTLALTNLAYATRVDGAASSSTKSQVDLILDRARRAMNECVSSKLCASLQGVEKSAYVIKSYDVVCSALSALALARDDEDDADDEHYSAAEPSNELASLQYFESKLNEETTKYVGKVMASHFGELTHSDADADVERSLDDFLATWRRRLQTTHASCVSCFGGPGSRANALFVKCADAVYAAYARNEAERTLPTDCADDRVSAAMFQVEVRRLVASSSSQQTRTST